MARAKPKTKPLRNAALEAALCANRTDRGAVSVHADWLQPPAQPEGELFLTAADVRAVRAAFAGVTMISKAQKTEDTSIPGESYRYVSVHE